MIFDKHLNKCLSNQGFSSLCVELVTAPLFRAELAPVSRYQLLSKVQLYLTEYLLARFVPDLPGTFMVYFRSQRFICLNLELYTAAPRQVTISGYSAKLGSRLGVLL